MPMRNKAPTHKEKLTMLTTRARTKLACLLLAQGLAACGGSAQLPSTPSPASAPAPEPPAVSPAPMTGVSVLTDATLSGKVYEVLADSPRGIEGVAVYCEPCGESTHNW